MSFQQRIDAVQKAERAVERRRENFDDSLHDLKTRARRSWLPKTLMVGGILAGALLQRALVPGAGGSTGRVDAEPANGEVPTPPSTGHTTAGSGNMLARLSSGLGFVQIVAPLAMQLLDLHHQQQDRRHAERTAGGRQANNRTAQEARS